MNALKWNLRYVAAINSCDQRDMQSFIVDCCGAVGYERFMCGKRYLWNLIRGKSFYLGLAEWLSDTGNKVIETETLRDCVEREILRDRMMERIDRLVPLVMRTERSEKAKRTFVWNLTKRAPILTVDTIRYMSDERVYNILMNGRTVVNDSAVQPFINAVHDLRLAVDQGETLVNMMLDGSN